MAAPELRRALAGATFRFGCDSRGREASQLSLGKDLLSACPVCFVVSALPYKLTSYLKACFKISKCLGNIIFNYCNLFLI